VVQRSARATAFIDALAREVEQLRPHAMLNPGTRGAYAAAVAKRAQDVRLTVRAHAPRDASKAPSRFLAQVNAQDFIGAPDLHEEIFGPAALVIVADSTHELEQVLHAVGGSPTVTLWGAESPNGIEHLVRTTIYVAVNRFLRPVALQDPPAWMSERCGRPL
jgi:NADP-dependent aldehyde dehydrogenase